MAATAVEAWDERWATPEGRADWLVPHSAVAAVVPVVSGREHQPPHRNDRWGKWRWLRGGPFPPRTSALRPYDDS